MFRRLKKLVDLVTAPWRLGQKMDAILERMKTQYPFIEEGSEVAKALDRQIDEWNDPAHPRGNTTAAMPYTLYPDEVQKMLDLSKEVSGLLGGTPVIIGTGCAGYLNVYAEDGHGKVHPIDVSKEP